MNYVIEQDEPYAEYGCVGCNNFFADRIPGIDESLPLCPVCNGLVRIMAVLVPVIWWGSSLN